MNSRCPIPKILIPVDGSKDSMRAVLYAGCLGAFMGETLSGVTLLRVLSGGYLTSYMADANFHAENLIKSDVLKQLREEHVNQHINPMLDQSEKILKESGVDAPIEKMVSDGDPGNQILKVAREGNFSTIIMARKGASELSAAYPGNVTSKVIHGATRQTVYIVGNQVSANTPCPVQRVLIPVDGSSYSMRGTDHVRCLAAHMKGAITGVTLLSVINLALFMERLRRGSDPESETREILTRAKTVFTSTGDSEKFVASKIRTGKPSDEIIKEATAGHYHLIVLGRKGRSSYKELILGGVSSTVLQRCSEPTIAIVSSEYSKG
jgi:nucleotide-binding universal stress UspA family protein